MKKSLVLLASALAMGALARPVHKSFTVHGSYVEGCSCAGPCPCDLTGPNMSCEGVGFWRLDHASYDGMDISGVKGAMALGIGKWVAIYVDAPKDKRDAAVNFFKDAFAAFGPITSVTDAKITIEGSGGTFNASVNDGAIMSLQTVPVLGFDNKNPLTYQNVQDPIARTIMQGKTVALMYNDGGHSFSLKDSNAYFNDHIRSQGELEVK